MQIAVLPFNAGPDTRPELARQFASFMVEIAAGKTQVEINAANYMAQVQEGGLPKVALINPAETLNEPDMIAQFKGQAGIDTLVDGLFVEKSGGGTITIRSWRENTEAPYETEEFSFLPGGLFEALRGAIQFLIKATGSKEADLGSDADLFGTEDSEAFTKFLEGYDAVRFMEQSQGNMVSTWDPAPYMDKLLEAVEGDRDWEAPYMVLLQLCRHCGQMRVGDAHKVEATLKKLIELEPDDSRGLFAAAEFYEIVGNAQEAANFYEKSAQKDPDEPAIIHRLARMQLAMGMPVNAERNLRKAIEMEGADKPSLDLLSDVLAQTGRVHEVPELWKEVIRNDPQNGKAHARYAMSLIANNRKEEAIRAFDEALETLDDNTFVKRYYAPVLAQDPDEIDRAMDFYEDCIDVAPTDHQLLWEYAQTLGRAGREFEVPETLRTILGSNPDPNLAANAQAWLLEIEEPKRVEAVKEASQKAEAGDYEGALRDLKPLKQWLGDYWKMWILIASAHNQLEQYEEAEAAARRTLEIFPAMEAGYVELNNALGGQGKHEEAFQIMQIAFHNMNSSLPVAISYAAAARNAGHDEESKRITGQIREAIIANGGAEQNKDLLAALDHIDNR
ncbi:MAG: tetratricopeptide repeat protein [Armatimonadetes bacterium]|nr:tetratricopeptide repeat protein [Armatimonadota bacterium]MBX3108620.1 tetratricopeptide repeat protein [Fimbriimonadaceae bacterium]